MNPAEVLRQSRHRAGLSQRELATRAGVPQSTVARIEAGQSDPHLSLFSRLLSSCGQELEAMPQLGVGVDRSQLRANLRLTPSQRLSRLAQTARNLAGWHGIARRRSRKVGQTAAKSAEQRQA